jgi:hypothetical protein
LLLRLKWYGITGKDNNWIKSYLVHRYERMEKKNINFNHQMASKWGKIRHGVPQGPLLFLLYINDLPNFVKNTCTSKPILLADDTSIISYQL